MLVVVDHQSRIITVSGSSGASTPGLPDCLLAAPPRRRSVPCIRRTSESRKKFDGHGGRDLKFAGTRVRTPEFHERLRFVQATG